MQGAAFRPLEQDFDAFLQHHRALFVAGCAVVAADHFVDRHFGVRAEPVLGAGFDDPLEGEFDVARGLVGEFRIVLASAKPAMTKDVNLAARLVSAELGRRASPGGEGFAPGAPLGGGAPGLGEDGCISPVEARCA